MRQRNSLCPELGANGSREGCNRIVPTIADARELELLNRIGIGAAYEHDVALANRFRAGVGVGLVPSDSAD